MKYLLTLLASCLLIGCVTTMPHEKFFCTISTKDIPDVPEKTISYKTDVIDYHFPEAGSISDPLFDYDIKYDTLSHYRVAVLGRLVFGKGSYQESQYERIDSVGITRLVIYKKGEQGNYIVKMRMSIGTKYLGKNVLSRKKS